MLTISPKSVFFIIVKAREFDAKVAPLEPHSASNPSDDGGVEILEDYKDDPTLQELTTAIETLNEDEKVDLLALAWFGRGSFDSWREALTAADAMRAKNIRRYLLGTPQLGDYLEEGISRLGYSLEEYELERL
jgi:hypothetical protein